MLLARALVAPPAIASTPIGRRRPSFLQVYNGGKLLHQLNDTLVMNCDDASNPQWCTWLQTGLPVCHTPRAARICFTLYARQLGKKDGNDTPLAWVSCQLFNHKDQLLTGVAHPATAGNISVLPSGIPSCATPKLACCAPLHIRPHVPSPAHPHTRQS